MRGIITVKKNQEQKINVFFFLATLNGVQKRRLIFINIYLQLNDKEFYDHV
jgi:hypothetical protein